MKKLFFVISFIFSFSYHAQDIKADIKNQFQTYNDLIGAKKFNEALEIYGNEDYLNLFSKANLVELMEKMFNDPGITLNLISPSNITVSEEIIKQKGKDLVKINFNQKLEMRFNDPDLNLNDIRSALQKSFGSDHVNYEEKTGYFTIDTDKLAVASSTNLKDWKFIVLEKKQIPVLKDFIPEQILKEIKQ